MTTTTFLPGILQTYFPPDYPAEVFLNPGTPPYFDEAQRTWHFFSYADVLRILTDPSFEVSYAAPSHERSWTYAGLWSRAGEEHRVVRSAEAHAYAPRAVAPFRERITGDAQSLLASILVRADGHLEFITEFAAPLSIRASARVLGLEAEVAAALPQLVAWMQVNVQELQLSNLLTLCGHQPLRDYVASLLQQRTRSPRRPPHLLDELVANRSIDDLDRLGVIWTQMIEAADTLTSSLGYALLAFLQFGLFSRAGLSDREMLERACEEALRLLPAFPAVFRLVPRDLSLGGRDLARGQCVTGWLSAANRDPEMFPDPHRFDPTRATLQHHLAFGGGRHICLGKSLAQLVMPSAFAALLDLALPSLRLDPHQAIEQIFGINNSLLRLPLLFGQETLPQPAQRASVAQD